MATTATTTPNPPVTYALLVIFTVDAVTHERLQDQQVIRDEAKNWLGSLNATVHGVNIRKADYVRRRGASGAPLRLALPRGAASAAGD